MSIINSSKDFLLYPYRNKPLRFLIIFFAVLFLLYVALAYTLVPFLLTKAIKDNYYQITGHQLQSERLTFNPFKYTLEIHQLKDSANLWQAESVNVEMELMQSIRHSILIVDEINIHQLVANPHQLENGTWNFDDVLKNVAAVSKKSTIKNPAIKKTPTNDAPVLIKKMTINNAAINSNVLALNNLSLAVAPLNITLNNIDLQAKNLTTLATLSLNAYINKNTPLEIKGSVNPHTLQVELDIAVSAIPFVWFNSALKPYFALEVLDGSIATHSHISISDGALENIVSSGQITNLKLRPANIEQDIVKWKAIAWSNAAIAMNEKSVQVPLISIDGFDGQFIIHKDRTNNIQAMLLKPVAPEITQPNSLVASADPIAAAPWKFAIDRVAINNAAVGFYDQSLTPSFMAIVQQFSGDITHISNDEQQTAIINLIGNVDGTAPVHLSGEAKPFMAMPQADVLFSFDKMDMGALSPYSAEYAGWRIKRGLLSVDLRYRYEKGLIVGKNHVVIDHLVFGEKVRSPHTIDIPLRFGLALLTDENGIAVFDADISGDFSNPNFNIGALFMRALRNSFKKIITSPFRFLSGLIHSNEDLGRVEFTHGESQLSEQAISKLTLLHEALKKRPAMRLSIQGLYDANMDESALKEEQVKSLLQKQGVTPEENKNHNASWEHAVTLYYRTQAAMTPGLTKVSASAEEKFQDLVAIQVVTPERLERLAHERALAVKQYLVLQLGAVSDNLFLNAEIGCAAANKCSSSAVVFTLEN